MIFYQSKLETFVELNYLDGAAKIVRNVAGSIQ
jgi:hypothetical protein